MISFIPSSSRINRTLLVIGIACLLTTFAGVILVAAHKDENLAVASPSQDSAPTAVDSAARTRVAEQFGKLPLSFEINKGQTDQSVKFLSHGPGYDLFLTSTEAVLRVPKPRALRVDKLKEAAPAKTKPAEDVREGTVLRLKFLGANAAPASEGQEELPGKVNYFIGNDPEKWNRNIPTYRRVYFTGVYPGIDVVYYGNQQELEYDLVVAPKANPKLIRFTVEGADRVRLDKSGRLLLTVKHGEISLNKPVIYQLSENGSRREVKGGYSVTGNEVRFKLESFDASKPLVIDPVLSYSTLLGSNSEDSGLSIAVDSQGSAYVTGTTQGTTFPTTSGAFKTTVTRGGAFVTKLDPAGSTLIYSTYLNGNSGVTTGAAVSVDSAGNAHVTGTTSASDFPVVNGLKTASNFFKSTDSASNWNNQNSGPVASVSALAVAPNAPNTIYAGATEGFYRSTDGGATWTKTPGTGLPSFLSPTALAVDPTNSSVAYLGTQNGGLLKTTNGGNNWTTVNTIPLNFAIVSCIVFDPSTPATIYVGAANGVYKSTNSGSTWIAQNNFGIPGTPNVRALAVDPATPLTVYAGTFGNGLFKSTNGGGVWTAMNNGMGGPSPLAITSVVIDPSSPATIYTGHGIQGGINKSVNGATSWTPLTNGVPAFPINAMTATSSAVYAAVNSAGVIKTTNGGASWTNANAGLWSAFASVLVRHPTDPATLYAGTIAVTFNDAFITKLNASGSGVLFSSLLGGSSDEMGNDIAVDGGGNIYVVGRTNSLNFPSVNAAQAPPTATNNCFKAFATKVNPSVPSFVFSTYLHGSQCDAANSVATDGSGNTYVTGSTNSTDFPTTPNSFQPAIAGPQSNFEAFVTKLSTGGSLSYSTYLGGANGSENAFGIAADSSGNAYVTGLTGSTNFPTLNPIQANHGGSSSDVFLTKLNSQGSALVYSTFLGGSGIDIGLGIALDSANNAYITGHSESTEFPLVAGAIRTKSAMYKSIDGASNWSNDNAGFTGSSVTCVAIHPTQTSTVYAGTPNGVFRSTNGGRSWSAINTGLDNRSVVALVIDPSTPTTLYAATSGLFGNSGVYKSTNSGDVWDRRVTGMTSTDLVSLAIDPATPNTLYAGSIGGFSRIFKTTNGADSWAQVGSSTFVAGTLVIDPLNHTTLYAADYTNAGGIFKSIDSGATWQGMGLAQTGPFARSVAVSPFTAGLVYAGTDQGLFKSVDGGSNWTAVPGRSGRVVFDPVSSSTLYLLSEVLFSTSQGLLKSTDNGQTWIALNKGLNEPRAIALAINPERPSTLYLASTPASGVEAFVTKINSAGSALVYSTLLGGPINPQHSSSISAQGFGIALDPAGNAYVTGLTSSLGFPATPNSYQPFNRGLNDAFISKLTMSYVISGKVLDGGGVPVSGAEVVLNDFTSLTSVVTENDGSYQFLRLREGGNFTVAASKPHFTLAPSVHSLSNLHSDQVLNFTATATNAPFHTISGKVTENSVGLGGVTVTLSGSQAGLRTTDSNGNYSFELPGSGNYTVTPSLIGFAFGPTSRTFNNLSAPQTADFAANRQSFVVTNTNNHGTGSLREAIINANATLGTDTITFNIPGTGVKLINLSIALPEITDRVVIDGTSQPGFAGSPVVELDGLGVSTGNGLVIKASGSTVRGLSIVNFRGGAGISLNTCDNNLIQGNYVGVAADGITERANNRGIILTSSSNNTIGGLTAAARNVISGNDFDGIQINGNGNVVQGNFIGTNAAGTAALPNATGIAIFNNTSANNLIGGIAAGAGNLISGNQLAITTNGAGTTIQGNLVGTDVTGKNAVPNSIGIQATGENMLIGGLIPGSRNIVSGNQGDGVYIRGAGSRLQGNFIGTDITGTLALRNNGTGVTAGEGALVGGTVPEARNIISANGNLGNVSLGTNNSGSAATVQGNYIGTDVTGTRALAAGLNPGINISSNNNIIGGTAASARNVISGNSVGIQLGGFFASGVVGNVIQGNFIGVNAAGTGQLPNRHEGIKISDAVNNTIGGTQSGAANTIAFNDGPGITISVGTGNVIRGNSIFSNNGLGIDLGTTGVTPNDVNDADTGANHLQNFPVLTTVMSTSNSTTIQGSLKSFPNTTFQIDFYSNTAVDPSGNGEGAQFFNTTSVNTNGNGDATINATFPVALATGRVITATATDPNGNTSEFSAADPAPAAGSVQFSVNVMTVNEDIGVVTINVLRTGGAAGSLTVDYATTDGTATAGQDYTATSGTLSFTGGETSKTIQVPIANDSTTETDETFTISLRNGSSLETLGAPSTMTIMVQDRSTAPSLLINSPSMAEGTGGTTEALFTVTLTAATGRAVSANYATGNFTAFGGATCNTQGADYEITSGVISFQPGSTTFTIPVKVCGDTSAEANEILRVLLSNATGATIVQSQGLGTIVDDDVLELALEEPPNPNQAAAALDARLHVRDPFSVLIPEWLRPSEVEQNTRISLFARNLQLNPGESSSAVVVRLTSSSGAPFVFPALDVRPIPNSEFTQVTISLPTNMGPGTYTVLITAHTRVSNSGTLRIAP